MFCYFSWICYMIAWKACTETCFIALHASLMVKGMSKPAATKHIGKYNFTWCCYYQVGVLGLIDVWYFIWLWYINVIGIHFVGCDCDFWIRFVALACNSLHWQATRWVIYNNNNNNVNKDLVCMCAFVILCALFE